MAAVDDDLASFLEHHRDAVAYARLHLSEAPVGLPRVTNEHAGLEEFVHRAGKGTGMGDTRDLTSLIGSRICHDLISPIGAIGNGLELLSMSGVVAGPEMTLIAESVENANARIRFFRVAFGAARGDSAIDRNEIVAILGGLRKATKSTVHWEPEGVVPRAVAKLAFLCLQCLENAMPWGGRVVVTRRDAHWQILAEAPRFRDLPELWAVFDDPAHPHDLAPVELQFALAPIWAADSGLTLRRATGAGTIALSFGPG